MIPRLLSRLGLTSRRLSRRALCAIGVHRPLFAYVPTGSPSPPLYRPETACIWCLKVLG